jgi:alpha-L-rhamnosidase
VLTETGRADLAYDLATQTTYPSWGYMVENGATTLWELWQNRTGPSMNSHNHPIYGSIGVWFYAALAGINVRQDGAGYKSIRIEPQIVRDLQYASGTLETVRGTVISSWTRAGSTMRMDVTVPVGSTAEVIIPKLNLRNVSVTEGGKIVWQDGAFRAGASGVSAARETSGAIIVEVGSGSYAFERKGD